MNKNRRKALVEIGMCVDLAICCFGLLITSALLYEPLWKTDTLLLTNPLRQFLVTGALGLVWHFSLLATGAYKSYRLPGLRSQLVAIARGTGLITFWMCVWLSFGLSESARASAFTLEQVVLFWAITFSGLIVTRLAARAIARMMRHRGRNLRNVLIVGSNRRAVALADRLLGAPALGLRLAGFVDDFWQCDDAPAEYKTMLLGSRSDLLELLRNLAIDEVIIALPIASNYQFSRQIVHWCRQQGIPVRSEGSLFDLDRHAFLPDSSNESDFITHHEVVHSQWSIFCKRFVDVFVSGVALLTLSPILLLIALAISVTSPGPVLFAQERLGVNKRRFRIWKFRTMVTNAEALMAQVEHLNQTQGPTFKLANDPRITKIGNFLRKTSLDELPQLINVLRGDMSLVGPRPLPLRDYRGFSADWHRRRFSVKPGITCLWQITGRSSITFDRWMELDMDYIDHWSLLLDFQILIKTIPAVVRGSGAV
jgi:exopolysaccharide biosynthesis polyprenyl glycosylphosphotransferase